MNRLALDEWTTDWFPMTGQSPTATPPPSCIHRNERTLRLLAKAARFDTRCNA